jgi:hypothetical protein
MGRQSLLGEATDETGVGQLGNRNISNTVAKACDHERELRQESGEIFRDGHWTGPDGQTVHN